MTATKSWRAWSSTVRVTVDDDRTLPDAAETVTNILDRVDRIASRFRDDSFLSRANRQVGKPIPAPRDLVDLVAAALTAAQRTDGLVDPTVGEALIRWGYDRDIGSVPHFGPAVAPRPPAASWRQVRLDAGTGLLTVPPGSMLDLGATAKAFTADHAARVLHRRFGTPVLVELGGDLAVAGARRGGWTVRVAEREGGDGEAVVLHHGGLATSTTVVRRWVRGGAAVHHIIDPRIGAPARPYWRTVTAAGPTALAANTASTAAIVLGADAVAWLRQHRVAARLVSETGRVTTTAGWPTGDQRAAS
jgi:FAD:protein FMN transferase